VFRGGVEVVTADVVVIDKSGQIVADLKPSDFVVVADKRPRRVISADYIAARTTPVPPATKSIAPAKPVAPPPAPSSNMHSQNGRTFVFAIDEDEIRAGAGRGAFARVSEYLDKLGPEDRVGLVAMPTGTPRVDLTTDRAPIRKALESIVGMSTRYRDLQQMTPGEAESIVQGDSDVLAAYFERTQQKPNTGGGGGHECGMPATSTDHFAQINTVPDSCKQLADMTLDQDRLHTRQTLGTLSALATAMAPISGPKTLVFVSEGMTTDFKTADSVKDFASACEKARVSLYAIHLDAPLMEASSGLTNNVVSREMDDRIGFDSMGEVALAARGEVIRSIATPDAALRQIDTETSGYYLLAFERDLDDKDGTREKIDVKVNRPGLDVRARAEFTPGLDKAAATSIAPPADPKAALASMLAWPVAVSEIPIVVDTFVTPDADTPAQIHVLVSTEISDYGRSLLGVGYEIDDVNGKTIANNFDGPPVVTRLDATRSAYAVSVPLPGGHFRMKIGVIDADGRRGSVEHAFDVPPYVAGLHVGDLMLGDPAASGFRPLAHLPADAAKLGAVVDIRADTAGDLQGVTATLHLIKVGTEDPIATLPITLKGTNDPLRVMAAATLNFSALPKGAYLAIVTVHQPGKPEVGRIRVFGK
jgi:VWFA-related protein